MERLVVPRARLELAFICTTIEDSGMGLNGTLCRGEFLEILLRVVKIQFERQKIAKHLE